MKTTKNWKVIHEESLKWARWIALFEAVQYAAEKADEKGIPFEKVDLKPLKILEYMDSVQDVIMRKILKQEHNIDICYDDKQEYQYSP
jgi:hypothetical protein